MFELWVNQAVNLSAGQAVLLLALSLAAIGLLAIVGKENDNAQP